MVSEFSYRVHLAKLKVTKLLVFLNLIHSKWKGGCLAPRSFDARARGDDDFCSATGGGPEVGTRLGSLVGTWQRPASYAVHSGRQGILTL